MQPSLLKSIFTLISSAVFISSPISLGAQSPAPPLAGIENYKLGPDSKPQPGVPKGKKFTFEFKDSKIFPNTSRIITVYVPAQYKGDKPACVYVEVGDGGFSFLAPTVFDNLIFKGEMPVTIAVGISPGKVTATDINQNPRFNRSFELDGLDDSLARCIVEEIFPVVERHLTPDGLPIKLSNNPDDRCTGGASTGGIAAFTLAWERPDLFRRVFTAIGTFVGMRGGDRYPVLVRKTEPKPIRVFQQDGENDASAEFGDWWMSNQTLERALEFAGYDHQHVWGTGQHNPIQAMSIFPDAMRFLWKDWPDPVQARLAKTKNSVLASILDPDSLWQSISNAGEGCSQLVVNPQGDIFFRDSVTGCTRMLNTNDEIADFPTIASDQPFEFAADGHVVTVTDIHASCLTVTSGGDIYATEFVGGKVWLIKSNGSRNLLDEGLNQPTGIALSPDGLWLAVMESSTHWGYSYRVMPDGMVDSKQKFYWAHVPDWSDDSGAGSMCMDLDGRLYVATHMGIQVFDRNGRSRAILPMPTGDATSICFGGTKFDYLFVTSGGKLYKRHMKVAGAPSFRTPIKLPRWQPS